MKKFIIHTVFFVLIVIFSIYLILIQQDGYSDFFYIRFTTPPQNSLILGTSRAAQGIVPSVLNSSLKRNDVFNYSFTIQHSPYGPIYLSSIKRKLSQNAKNGIFILSVDPWSISSTSKNPNDTLNFREVNLCLGQIHDVNDDPNITYLIKSFENHYFYFMKNYTAFLHKDGWLEVSLQLDSNKVKNKRIATMKKYKNNIFPRNNYSDLRYEYLNNTIKYLKKYGSVYLVRLPIHNDMYEIEKEYMPKFDELMNEIYLRQEVEHFYMTSMNNNFIYNDGNHLAKQSGVKVTKLIADWILGLN